MGFNAAKRINKIYRLLLILLIISLSLTGCVWNDLLGQDTSEGFEKGFEYDESWMLQHKGTYPVEIGNVFYCACKGDKSEFNINFVILDFFYGGDFDDDLEKEMESHDYPCFELRLSNDFGDSVVAKRVYHNLVSEKYRCEKKEYEFSYEIAFSHSEKIWIPGKLFKNEKGVIYIGLYGAKQSCDASQYNCLQSMAICYKVVDNKVILSAEKIK